MGSKLVCCVQLGSIQDFVVDLRVKLVMRVNCLEC